MLKTYLDTAGSQGKKHRRQVGPKSKLAASDSASVLCFFVRGLSGFSKLQASKERANTVNLIVLLILSISWIFTGLRWASVLFDPNWNLGHFPIVPEASPRRPWSATIATTTSPAQHLPRSIRGLWNPGILSPRWRVPINRRTATSKAHIWMLRWSGCRWHTLEN